MPGNELHLFAVHSGGSVTIKIKSFDNTTGERVVNSNNSISSGYYGAFFYAGPNVAGTVVQGSGKINIQEFTADYIKGTFEGIVPIDPAYGVANPPLNFTEGEFKLKRQ